MDYGIIAQFGALVLVVAVICRLFRHRSLGTTVRLVASLLAIGLLGLRLARDQGMTTGSVLLVLIAAVILGSGIWYLRRVEQLPPPE